MTLVRLMREDDADAVRDIDATAFGAWWQQVSGQSVPLPRRTRTNVLACREKDPDGAFVAEEEGQVLGYIFSRTWGRVGWFGPFAVLPEYQGRGIGQQLVAASLAYLRREPGRTLGLETMAESPYNLGLYLRRGFRATLPSFVLTTAPARPPRDPGLERWSAADAATRARWLADLRRATGHIQPGLDYVKEIESTARHGLGETLVLCQGRQAIGFSCLWLASSREQPEEGPAAVQAMALHPAFAGDDTLDALLGGSEALAQAHGREALTVPVNGGLTWALERLLARGYRVARVMIRMVLNEAGGAPPPERAVDFSRWAG